SRLRAKNRNQPAIVLMRRAAFPSRGFAMTRLVSRPAWSLTGVAAGLVATLLLSFGCRKADAPPAGSRPPSVAKVQTGPAAPKPPAVAPTKDDPFAPMVEVQDEDYAHARGRFRTKLTRKGPSPQPGEPVKPPTGVTEVEYRSGELTLKAWL